MNVKKVIDDRIHDTKISLKKTKEFSINVTYIGRIKRKYKRKP